MKLLPIVLLCFLFACGGATDTTVTEEENTDSSASENTTETESVEETIDELSEEEIDAAIPMLISKGSFYGVQIGDNLNELISGEPDRYEEGVLQTGEGEFPVIHILDEQGETIGDIFPSDESYKVDMIYVYAENAETDKGLKIGKTFADILEIYPEAVPHGSEIEGQVSVEADGIFYKLDANIYEYDIDLESFDKQTKIITIIL